MHLLQQNQGSTGIVKKAESKPLWPTVQPHSNFNKENSLFAQLPQETDKHTRTQTPRCQCELILSAHVPGCALEDLEGCLCCAPPGFGKAEMRAALAPFTE